MNNSRYISVPHVLKEYKINTAQLLYIIVTEVMIKSEKNQYIYMCVCVCVCLALLYRGPFVQNKNLMGSSCCRSSNKYMVAESWPGLFRI